MGICWGCEVGPAGDTAGGFEIDGALGGGVGEFPPGCSTAG